MGKLVGFGLIDDVVLSLRPWSRREALRLVEEARRNLDGIGGDGARPSRVAGGGDLDATERAAAREVLEIVASAGLNARAHLEARADATVLDSPWLPVTTETIGSVDAVMNPLVRHREGRAYVDGETYAGELDFGAVLHHRIALSVRPRAHLARRAGGGTRSRGRLLAGQLRLQLGNLRVDVGRSYSVWGPGRDGGTLLTANARGLDRVRISSDTPFRWPGFLRVLGPSQAEAFLAVLEADRDIPYSRLVGYTVSVRPHPLVEAWFSTLIQSGGDGAPDASTWERVADHLLVIDWIFNGGETFLFSNKGTSVGFRVRVPSLRHSQLFAELTLEDKAHNLKRLFWQDAAWLLGIEVPRLDAAGRWDLRAEFHHGGIRMHRHSQFTSGRTLDARILGMGGPSTDGGFLEVATSTPRLRIAVELGVENRSDDRWSIVRRDDGGLDVLEKTEDRPDELYLRTLASVTAYGREGRALTLGLGLERVSDSLFQEGAVRHDLLFEIRGRVPVWRSGR